MAGEEKKSRKPEKVGLNTLIGRIADGLKSMTEIGILDDLSGILKTLARNKDYIVTLVEKSYSFSVETNKVWVDRKSNIESMITEGDRLICAFSADSENLAKNVGSLTSDMAAVAGGLSGLVNEASVFLPEVRKTLAEAGGLAAEAGTAIPVAKELAERSLAAVNQVNAILPTLAATAGDASAMIKEMREMMPQIKALLTGANGLMKEADGLLPKAQRALDALNRALPKLDKVDGKSLKKFFQEDGLRIFLKKLPF
ncbi:MAG: hypothetical protein HZB23_16440 [Deltaproteobacteria bacterium]|nr:hypothetical protein [Deltaproteobacteria bacterium]